MPVCIVYSVNENFFIDYFINNYVREPFYFYIPDDILVIDVAVMLRSIGEAIIFLYQLFQKLFTQTFLTN